MYEYHDLGIGIVIQKRHDTGSTLSGDEVYLVGDDAVTFLREIHRAEQKELSKRCNPNNIPISQNVMAQYFTRG
jgi:hypothetical protein